MPMPFIRHPQADDVLARIERCHRTGNNAREPEGLAITGEAGVGKSMAAEHYQLRYPSQRDENGVTSPVLYSTIPAGATIKGMQTELLTALGDPRPDRGNRASQDQRLQTLFSNCGVELLFLDEFQHLTHRAHTNTRVLQDVADWLKNLISQAGLPVVLFGMPEAQHVLEHDRQLKRRFSSNYRMTPFGLRDGTEVKNYRRFLRETEKHFLKTQNWLDSREMVTRIHAATGGYPSEIIKLVDEAARQSRTLSNVTRKAFARAFELTTGYSHEIPTNPFEQSVKALEGWPCMTASMLQVSTS
jgi:type II secretory pathway predicted ATPase ExeA